MPLRAQCSNCMRVTTDPEIAASRSPERQPCPNCGERRLVVLDRGDAPTSLRRDAPTPRQKAVAAATEPLQKVDPALRRHVASNLRRALGWE
jgi:hypothetical protein